MDSHAFKTLLHQISKNMCKNVLLVVLLLLLLPVLSDQPTFLKLIQIRLERIFGDWCSRFFTCLTSFLSPKQKSKSAERKTTMCRQTELPASVYKPNLLFFVSERLPADIWLPCREEALDDGLELACRTRLVGERCCCCGDSRGDAQWDDASKLLMLLARLSDEWCCSTRIKLSRSARSACMFFTLQMFQHFSRAFDSKRQFLQRRTVHYAFKLHSFLAPSSCCVDKPQACQCDAEGTGVLFVVSSQSLAWKLEIYIGEIIIMNVIVPCLVYIDEDQQCITMSIVAATDES